MSGPTPSTTTYALLALLALRSWTSYELTRQLRRSLHYAWPRSEANLYNEQKRLVRLGWATVTKEPVGRRTRTRYEITAAGRQEVRAWLSTEPSAPHLEVEGIVRMFFADHGSVDDLVHSLRATGDRAGDAVLELCEIVKDYFVTGGPFPDRLHAIALAADLVTDLLDRIESFSREASAEVVLWDTTHGRGLTAEARKRFEVILQRGERINAARLERTRRSGTAATWSSPRAEGRSRSGVGPRSAGPKKNHDSGDGSEKPGTEADRLRPAMHGRPRQLSGQRGHGGDAAKHENESGDERCASGHEPVLH